MLYTPIEKETLPQKIAYRSWLNIAKPGDRYVYFVGNALSENIIGPIMGRTTMIDAKAGRVYLVQKRVGPFMFEHIAIKAPVEPTRKLVPVKESTYIAG